MGNYHARCGAGEKVERTSKPYLSLFALPDDFDKLLATMRSREISVSIIIQNMAQIRALYKEQWESLVGNCDHFLFLGGNETGTHEYLSKALGKATIDTTTHGQTKGRSGSYSTNMQQTGRELILPNEVRTMDNADCLLLIRGEPPIMDKKYDLMRHPNIALTPDGGGKPYLHGQLTLFSDDLDIDIARVNDYVVLTVDEVLDTDKKDGANGKIDMRSKNEKQEELPFEKDKHI